MDTFLSSTLFRWLRAGFLAFLIAFVTCALLSNFAYADDISQPLPTTSFFTQLLVFLKSLSGTTVLAGVGGLVQLTIVFFRTSFGDFAGAWKLTVIFSLAVVYAVAANLLRGLPVLDALLDGTTVTAVSVLVNEVLKHFTQLTTGKQSGILALLPGGSGK